MSTPFDNLVAQKLKNQASNHHGSSTFPRTFKLYYQGFP